MTAGRGLSPSQDRARRPLALRCRKAHLIDCVTHHVAGIRVVLDDQNRPLAPYDTIEQRRQLRPINRLGQDLDGQAKGRHRAPGRQ